MRVANQAEEGGGGFISRPGQYIHRTEGGTIEARLLRQYAVALWAMRLGAFGAAGWIALVLGPTLSGIAALGWLAAWLWALTASPDESEPPPLQMRAGGLAFLVFVAAVWLAWGCEQVVPYWPTPFGFRVDGLIWYWRLALLAPPVAFLLMMHDVGWRLRNEITDPNWPGPIGVRSAFYGPARPGGIYDELPASERVGDELPPMTRGEMEDMIRAAIGKREVVESVRVEIVEPGDNGTGRIAFSDEIPLPMAKLRALARGVLRGRPFSELECTGKNRPLSSTEFRDLEAKMVEWEWAYWRSEKDHRQGVEFTRVGLRVLEEMA